MLGNIDGSRHVILRIEHPRHGPINMLLPSSNAMDLGAALAKTSERRDADLIENAATNPKEIESRIEQESSQFGHEWD
jgi:hypothetical protein